MAKRDALFRFIKENGSRYKRSTYDAVSIDPNSKIECISEMQYTLRTRIILSELTVREEGDTNALGENKDIVDKRGTTKENALVVIVPESSSKRQKVDESFEWKEEERIVYSLALQKISRFGCKTAPRNA
jgi:hypothetical protein